MESISTGPNHSAGVSVKKQVYSWGYSEGGRLGLSKEDAKKAKFEPTLVAQLMNMLQANKANEGRDDEVDDNDYGPEYDNNNESPEMVGNEDPGERKHGNL